MHNTSTKLRICTLAEDVVLNRSLVLPDARAVSALCTGIDCVAASVLGALSSLSTCAHATNHQN